MSPILFAKRPEFMCVGEKISVSSHTPNALEYIHTIRILYSFFTTLFVD